MENNNYILCRWRDAITDPPEPARGDVPYRNSKALFTAYVDYYSKNWHDESCDRYVPAPGDQWLDITTVPGVPREAVQAAVDEMDKKQVCDPSIAYRAGVLDARYIIANHTGVTPTEVQ